MRDLRSSIAVRTAIAPIALSDNTAAVGVAIDRQGFGSVTYAIATGTLADADATFTVLLEEADTSGGSYTAVADADLIGTEAAASFTFADDAVTRTLGYRGSKRFTKLTITPSGNSGSAPIAAVVILGHPTVAPVA
jgi:hypothetical protein